MTILVTFNTFANGIQVTSVKITRQNNISRVQFDLSWENSWRHPNSTGVNNWDAAWIFIKYRETGNTSAPWSHLYLSNNEGEYINGEWNGEGGSGAVIEPALVDPRVNGSGNLITPYSAAENGNPAGRNPRVGAFVYRENPGQGRFEVSGMSLAFNPSENGMDPVNFPEKLYDIKVFAIEMVYVPQGSFFLGTRASNFPADGWFILAGSINSDGFRVRSESIITTSSAPGPNGEPRLWSSNGALLGTTAVAPADPSDIQASFPKGFNSFYVMKYEVTQQQYVDFLNTLSYQQQQNRINVSPNSVVGTFADDSFRHKIKIVTSGVNNTLPAVFGTDLPFVPKAFMSTMDGLAYSAWAGLRPMTELEYEKAARGPLQWVAREVAHGSDSFLPITAIQNENQVNETKRSPDDDDANVNVNNNLAGPVRVGAFANSSTTRTLSGASYYGVMELSGNLYERIVAIGTSVGRAFDGTHGNGQLDPNGFAVQPTWPGWNGISNNNPLGSGLRGGAFSVVGRHQISHRLDANEISGRTNNIGFRMVRTKGCINSASAPNFDTSVSLNRVPRSQLGTYKVTESGSFQWVVPNTWRIVSGQGTNEIRVIFTQSGTGNVRVASYNSCGAGAEATLIVTVE